MAQTVKSIGRIMRRSRFSFWWYSICSCLFCLEKVLVLVYAMRIQNCVGNYIHKCTSLQPILLQEFFFL